MKDFILQLFYESDPGFDELVQARLFLTECGGSTSSEIGDRTIIEAYFDSAASREHAKGNLAGLAGLELREVDRERVDWLEHYEQSLEPLFIGERFVVAPDARLIPAGEARIPIIVPQEQAFGTGSHETTALCLAMLEELGLAGKRGLDAGTGSGILAIGMTKLGAAKVIAFDNDLDAYEALRNNLRRNGAPEIALFIGSIEALRGGAFDVVTMNIIPEVILPLLPQVVARLGKDASLVLSGILLVRRDDVVAACAEQGLRLARESWRGEWWCGVFGTDTP
jgi:ribosomal protein L11 methyltransferase